MVSQVICGIITIGEQVPTVKEIEYYILNLMGLCFGCKEKLDYTNTKEIVTDSINYIIMEKKIVCIACGVQSDYWAHGHSETERYQREFETEHPKAAELIQRMVGK